MIRLVELDDASALAELYTANRGFLAPWEPIRSQDFFTTDGQREAITNVLIERVTASYDSALTAPMFRKTGRPPGLSRSGSTWWTPSEPAAGAT